MPFLQSLLGLPLTTMEVETKCNEFRSRATVILNQHHEAICRKDLEEALRLTREHDKVTAEMNSFIALWESKNNTRIQR